MTNFQYTAFNGKGESVSGVIAANNEAEAKQMLQAQDLYPTQLAVAGAGAAPAAKGKSKAAAPKGKAAKSAKNGSKGRVKPRSLMIFTRQLATLIESGLPLLRSLTVLGKQEPNPVLKSALSTITDSVQGGATFSESLSGFPNIFDKLFINMVKAGELGGVLEIVLARLAEYKEKAQKLKNKVTSAMVYPIIVMFLAILIMVFLMLFIVPKFTDMFKQQNQELPMISKVVFGTSDFLLQRPFFLPNAVYILLAVIGVFMLIAMWGRTVSGREKLDAFKMKLPLLGDIQRKTSVARFSRTLGTLVTSGVPILQALNITKDTAGNVVVSEAIAKIHDAVKEGESVVTPMQATNVFPDMVISMVDVGEETGQLPEMLLKVADVYDDEVDNTVSAMTSILEPLMIVVLAVVVVTIVLALFLPLIKIIETMSQ